MTLTQLDGEAFHAASEVPLGVAIVAPWRPGSAREYAVAPSALVACASTPVALLVDLDRVVP